MIILDISGHKKTREHYEKEGYPLRIRLIQGQYKKDYDAHPMVRNTKWYKKMIAKQIKKYPDKRHDWPIGINIWELLPGMRIIES